MTHHNKINRRFFLQASSLGLSSCALGVVFPSCAKASNLPKTTSKRLCPIDEPGEPLFISGQVFQPDQITPAANLVLYVYHTDATGFYAARGKPPRLRAWIRTDQSGSFSYQSIRPAPYPGRTQAAHIHTQLWGEMYPAQWGTTLLFEGDPLISEREKTESSTLGKFKFIEKLTKKNGIWHGRHMICLKETGDTFEPVTRHGIRDAPVGFRPPS